MYNATYSSLTHEDPVYLQITYHYAYNLKYTKLKSLFEHWFGHTNQYTSF